MPVFPFNGHFEGEPWLDGSPYVSFFTCSSRQPLRISVTCCKQGGYHFSYPTNSLHLRKLKALTQNGKITY